MDTNYPTRCQIVNVDGKTMAGVNLRTPKVSIPHLSKYGTAELINGLVKITLDDGNIIWGHECWWKPVGQQIKVKDIDEK